MLYGGSERKCFIHIGTHKTGTTSIQHLLIRNSSALRERGYCYPQAGRLELSPGHHNLAWEISSDHRFRDNYGSIGDVIKEVINADYCDSLRRVREICSQLGERFRA